jgi:hypothetical protein
MAYFRPMLPSDRREFQRLRLAKPILGLLDGQNALILDVGVSGAYVEHYGQPAPGKRMTLLFRWKGKDVEFDCEVVHSDVIRKAASDVVCQSGLAFVKPARDSEALLNDMVATFIGKILAAQRANAVASNDADSAALVDLGGGRPTPAPPNKHTNGEGQKKKREPTHTPPKPSTPTHQISRRMASPLPRTRTTMTSARSAGPTRLRTKKGAA